MWAHTEKRIVLNNYGTFRNCLIVGNREDGIDGGYPTLENCTVADNRGVGVDAVLANIANSILYFNGQDAEGVNLALAKSASAVTYSDIQGGWAGEGNLDADPLFVALGDYHLQSQGWSWSTLLGTWAWDDATSPVHRRRRSGLADRRGAALCGRGSAERAGRGQHADRHGRLRRHRRGEPGPAGSDAPAAVDSRIRDGIKAEPDHREDTTQAVGVRDSRGLCISALHYGGFNRVHDRSCGSLGAEMFRRIRGMRLSL